MIKLLKIMSRLGNVLRLAIGIGLTAYGTVALATGQYKFTVGSIAHNVGSAVGGLAFIMQDVALVAGIGFILVSFFKFHQHKLQPTQVPISQGITLLVIGAALTFLPRLIATPGSALLGSKASVAQLGSNQIESVIGKPS